MSVFEDGCARMSKLWIYMWRTWRYRRRGNFTNGILNLVFQSIMDSKTICLRQWSALNICIVKSSNRFSPLTNLFTTTRSTACCSMPRKTVIIFSLCYLFDYNPIIGFYVFRIILFLFVFKYNFISSNDVGFGHSL